MKTRTAPAANAPSARTGRDSTAAGTTEATGSQLQKVGECLYRHTSSKVYYAWLKKSGKQFRKSLKTTDREIAKRKLRDLRAKFSHARAPQKNKVRFSTFADEWLSQLKNYLKPRSFIRRTDAVNKLKNHFANTPLIDISQERCERWAAASP